eukprot:TRINITY_DN692_c0_g1_i2.p1 TRINITY_DN692_c0_g1~~TRINITY_DN692_c0_g1_i2.p1  ORF type:complete len:158 (-),score=33.42 TRINITY_DN692_c0_g1_i2:62-502(-)
MTPAGLSTWIQQQQAAGNICLGAQQAFDPFIIPNNISGAAFLEATKSDWMSAPFNLPLGYALELERLKSFSNGCISEDSWWCCSLWLGWCCRTLRQFGFSSKHHPQQSILLSSSSTQSGLSSAGGGLQDGTDRKNGKNWKNGKKYN